MSRNGWADLQTGYRRVPRPGNAGYHREFVLQQLFPGTYYWTVQAVDETYRGSGFAVDAVFHVGEDVAPRLVLVPAFPFVRSRCGPRQRVG